MAYATQDRFGRMEANPVGKQSSFVLSTGARIFKHTLCGVLAADGKLTNITAANKNALSLIFYADEQLAADQFNDRVHAGGGGDVSCNVISDRVVFLETSGAFAPGDEGSEVFFVDDQTVTLTDAGDGSTPYVGQLKKVITADIVTILVPGSYRA